MPCSPYPYQNESVRSDEEGVDMGIELQSPSRSYYHDSILRHDHVDSRHTLGLHQPIQNRHAHFADYDTVYHTEPSVKYASSHELGTPSSDSVDGPDVSYPECSPPRSPPGIPSYAEELCAADETGLDSQKCSSALFISTHDEDEAFRESMGSDPTYNSPTRQGKSPVQLLHTRSSDHRFGRFGKSQISELPLQSRVFRKNKLLRRHAPTRSTKVTPETDPVNHAIKRMRTENLMSWADIVQVLNEESKANGNGASFTEAAVYSRFKRNAPRVALANGEPGFDPSAWMYLRPTMNGARTTRQPRAKVISTVDYVDDQNVAVWTAEDDHQLMEAYCTTMNDIWKRVAKTLEIKTKKVFHPRECEERCNCLKLTTCKQTDHCRY